MATAYVSELTKSLFEFQKAGYLCDTSIVVDDGQLKAHSAVLAAASPLFKDALRVESGPLEHTVLMPGIQLSVAEVIVQYMYTGVFKVEDQGVDYEHVNHLQQAADKFGISLQLVAEPRFVVSRLDWSSCWSCVYGSALALKVKAGLEMALNSLKKFWNYF